MSPLITGMVNACGLVPQKLDGADYIFLEDHDKIETPWAFKLREFD